MGGGCGVGGCSREEEEGRLEELTIVKVSPDGEDTAPGSRQV